MAASTVRTRKSVDWESRSSWIRHSRLSLVETLQSGTVCSVEDAADLGRLGPPIDFTVFFCRHRRGQSDRFRIPVGPMMFAFVRFEISSANQRKMASDSSTCPQLGQSQRGQIRSHCRRNSCSSLSISSLRQWYPTMSPFWNKPTYSGGSQSSQSGTCGSYGRSVSLTSRLTSSSLC